MIKKLRLKFVIINMGIVTLMLCVILGLVYHFTKANMEAESINMMRNIANNPLRLRIPNESGEDVRLPYFAILLGVRGELLAVGGGYYDLSDNEILDDLVEAVLDSPKTFGVIEEYHLRYYHVAKMPNHCIVFSDISSETATLNSLMKTCFFIGGLSFLLFLGGSVMLSKWAVEPVDRAWKQQRQFLSDASHELKTPLTVIMTNAELAQSPEYGEESRGTFLASILTMSIQMKGLIEQMLELARIDHTDIKAVFLPVDFSRLVNDGLLPFEPIFFEAGLTLESQIDGGITVTGEESQLRQVLEILLDNARKYSGAGGAVEVTLRQSGERRCTLTVANEGEPIRPEDLKNIFKRFYRIDQARSRTGSFGLGLSIAEGIVVQHRGKIWAESRNGINRFYVELPCS